MAARKAPRHPAYKRAKSTSRSARSPTYAHRRTGTGQPSRTSTYKYGAGSLNFNVVPAVEAWNIIKRLPREDRVTHVRTKEGWKKTRQLSSRGFKIVQDYINKRETLTEAQRKHLRNTYFHGFIVKKINDILVRNHLSIRLVARGSTSRSPRGSRSR